MPFPALAKCDPDYDSECAYWCGQVWPPTAYIAIRGLLALGFTREAQELGRRYYNATYELWKATGTVGENLSSQQCERPKILAGNDFCGWSALGPINMMIENVLGVRCDGVTKTVTWRLHRTDRHGVKRLRFGGVTADLVYADGKIETAASTPFTLVVNGRSIPIGTGSGSIAISN